MNINTKRSIIPIFFSTDNNYAPFLGVAIQSIIENSSKAYDYRIYVLTTDLSFSNRMRIRASAKGLATVNFVDVRQELERVKDKLHIRDYYTSATYFRFFIAGMFPQYKKALYLDCDIVVSGDISELYNTELGDRLVGAIPEEVMLNVGVFGKYVDTVLEMPHREYFNAGVLVMNLDGFRRMDIENRFVKLLSERRFDVTQDQDYLNVLCYKNSVLIDFEWNKTPFADGFFAAGRTPKLVHYKINWKPWHYDGVVYGDLFWNYADRNVYKKAIRKILRDYTPEERLRDSLAYKNLYRLAEAETIAAIEGIPQNA